MGYLSYSRGFKAGTFNPGSTDVVSLTTPVKPEELDAYEIGLKTEFPNQRIRFNSSAFYYDYSGIQVQAYTAGGVYLTNGAKAKVYGFDGDFQFKPMEHLFIDGGVEFLHSEFTSFPNAPLYSFSPDPANGCLSPVGICGYQGSATGNQLPVAPETTARLSASYDIPTSAGDVTLNANYAYNSGWFAGADNFLKQPSYNLINASVQWNSRDGRYGILLWGRNLANEWVASSLSTVAPWGNQIVAAPPRTYGISLSCKFGETGH
jgi:iron complex outermembrane recepter protein